MSTKHLRGPWSEKTTHTPEPWVINDKTGVIRIDHIKGWNEEYDCPRVEVVVAHFGNRANAERIVECVNAMAGIENPSEWVSQIKTIDSVIDQERFESYMELKSQRDELLEALRNVNEAINNMGKITVKSVYHQGIGQLIFKLQKP